MKKSKNDRKLCNNIVVVKGLNPGVISKVG